MMKKSLALSEDGKEDFPTATYSPQHNHLFQTLVHTWNFDTDFHGSYHNDYWLLRNEVEGIHTAWLDKYTSVINSAAETSTIEHFERQPLPDYIRWVNTSELHYLSLENQLKINTGVWDEISGLFLPTKILDMCIKVLSDSQQTTLSQFCHGYHQTKLKKTLLKMIKIMNSGKNTVCIRNTQNKN